MTKHYAGTPSASVIKVIPKNHRNDHANQSELPNKIKPNNSNNLATNNAFLGDGSNINRVYNHSEIF